MRPYLAILKDSFREAIASRVLLIALVGIVVLLLLLSPFGLSTNKATELRRSELRRPELFLKKLIAGADKQTTPQAHLWSLLGDAEQQHLREMLNPKSGDQFSGRRGPVGNAMRRQLVDQINELLRNEEFYHAQNWRDIRLSEEGTELAGRSDLRDRELHRRNLLLLVAAFPREIHVTESTAISLNYAGATVIGPIPLTPSEFEPIFDRIVLGVVGVFLGFFGVFGSLLVTGGIIPRTFEPGEIALLLSKPILRSGLFLTKVLGGCIFTLLYASLLVTGIWLLLGIRMDTWQHALLWCIPVYVFLFMLYYSISAVAGAIWRNAVVALAMVVLFWVGLQIVGVTKETLEERLVRKLGIKEIMVAGESLITVNGQRDAFIWNEAVSGWEKIFEESSNNLYGIVGRFMASGTRFVPVYDAKNDRILALHMMLSRFGGFGAPELIAGYSEDDWERVTLGRVPDITGTILVGGDGRILLPSSRRIHQYVGLSDREQQAASFLSRISAGLLGSGMKSFREVQPDNMPDLGDNFSAAIDPLSNSLLLFGNGRLHQLASTDDGRYALSRTLECGTQEPGVVAVSGRHAVLALSSGHIRVLDTATLETVHEQHLNVGIVPRICIAAPDGSALALLTHAETVLLFDAESGQPIKWEVPENERCSGVAWSPDGHLFVSDGRLAVRKYDITRGSILGEWAGETSWVYQFYDYVVEPLWTVLPKPSQLEDFVGYIMSDNGVVASREAPSRLVRPDNLQQDRNAFDPVLVLRDNAIFLAVTLFFGCVYVSTRDY